VSTRARLRPDERTRGEIPRQATADYYQAQILTPRAAVDHARANARLEGLTADPRLDGLLTDIATSGERDPEKVLQELVAEYTAST